MVGSRLLALFFGYPLPYFMWLSFIPFNEAIILNNQKFPTNVIFNIYNFHLKCWTFLICKTVYCSLNLLMPQNCGLPLVAKFSTVPWIEKGLIEKGRWGPFTNKLQLMWYNKDNSFYLALHDCILFWIHSVFQKLAIFLFSWFLTCNCRFRGFFCVPLASQNLAQQFWVAEQFLEDRSAEMWLNLSKAEGMT